MRLSNVLSLVFVRSWGVAARSLGLLALGSLLTVEEFALCGAAFAASEFGRCFADGGLDPSVLRKLAGAHDEHRSHVIFSALKLRLSHGSLLVGLFVVFGIVSEKPLLAILISLQFFSQSITQLGLNSIQHYSGVKKYSALLFFVYFLGVLFAICGMLGGPSGVYGLPFVILGELLFCAIVFRGMCTSVRVAYFSAFREFYPPAFSMAGIALLATINTRSDSIIVSKVLHPVDAGSYMLLMRWADIVPMFVGGIAMPFVGVIKNWSVADQWKRFAFLAIFVVLMIQLSIVYASYHFYGDPSGGYGLPLVLAGVGAVRAVLSLVTVLLLSHWQDKRIFLIAVFTSAAISLGAYFVGSRFGAIGVGLVVLCVESINLCAQWMLLRRSAQ